MLITEATWRHLSPTPLTFGERGGAFLQDPQAIPSVISVEVITEAVPGPRQSWEPGKGAGALECDSPETDVKDLWDVLHLIER